jgi:hypothetical protein
VRECAGRLFDDGSNLGLNTQPLWTDSITGKGSLEPRGGVTPIVLTSIVCRMGSVPMPTKFMRERVSNYTVL